MVRAAMLLGKGIPLLNDQKNNLDMNARTFMIYLFYISLAGVVCV